MKEYRQKRNYLELRNKVNRTPISTIILLSTLTGFHAFIPIMFASLTGFFLAPKTPLIASQLKGEPH